MFSAIGFGQWFRYFTGAVQLAGSGLLLVPGTARLGALLIASTMVGAIAAYLFVLDTGIGGAVIPGALLPLVIAAGWKAVGSRENPPVWCCDDWPVELRCVALIPARARVTISFS